MPENQVIAIYNHFLRDGVFNKTRVGKRPSDPNFRQFTLEDYGVDLGRKEGANEIQVDKSQRHNRRGI